MVSKGKNYANENTTLYAFKVLACFSVVALHTWLPLIGGLYQIVARFAVPLFFAITGFYSYQISQDKLKKRLRSILTLTFYSTIFYLVLYLIQYSLTGQLQAYLSQWSLTNTIRFIFFNRISDLVGTGTSPLWYLFALIYVYILMYFKSTRILLTNKLVLLVLLFSAFVLAFLTKDSLYYRNFLFTGVPFVGLGLCLAEIKDKLNKSSKTSIVAICLGLVALLLAGLEYLFDVSMIS